MGLRPQRGGGEQGIKANLAPPNPLVAVPVQFAVMAPAQRHREFIADERQRMLRSQNYAKAIELFTRVLDQNPRHVQSYGNLALAHAGVDVTIVDETDVLSTVVGARCLPNTAVWGWNSRDLLAYDGEGLVKELTVMVRPLSGILALAEEMRKRLEGS